MIRGLVRDRSSVAVYARRGGLPTCVQRSVRPQAKGRSSRVARGSRTRLVVRAGPVEIDEDDLMQFPDRAKWYEAKFCANDMPDWNGARFVRSEQLAPGLRGIVLEAEISRERVPLRNAYKSVGQKASVRVNNGIEYQVVVASAPYSMSLNKDPLVKVRGDLFAYEIKLAKEVISIFAELHLLVRKEDAPEVYELTADETVEVGPFTGTGLDLKGSGVMAIYRFPTLVMFVEGMGIASARALLTATSDVADLSVEFRRDVRLYYKVPNAASICYKDELEAWEATGCKVVTTTAKTFAEAFDDDDTLAYDPETTAALVLTGGDEEAQAGAMAAVKEAEIAVVIVDSEEMQQEAVEYCDTTPSSFVRRLGRK